MIIEKDGIDYLICDSQANIIENIQFILKENVRFQTINGDQVFFKINCGELTFRVLVEKLPDSRKCNPCDYYKGKFKCELL